MKILVVVPAYNEANAITPVLVALRSNKYDILVVDDGSSDVTGDVARAHGVIVVRHLFNRGLGAALRTGFAYAVDHDYDAVITLDADGQHSPVEISRFCAALDRGADVVIGQRERSAMPLIRQIYTACGALVTSGLFGGPLIDSQSGFRALRCSVLKKFNLTTSRMEISSEILAEAHRVGASVEQVPISVKYTQYSMSKGQGFFEGMRTMWRLLLKSFS